MMSLQTPLSKRMITFPHNTWWKRLVDTSSAPSRMASCITRNWMIILTWTLSILHKLLSWVMWRSDINPRQKYTYFWSRCLLCLGKHQQAEASVKTTKRYKSVGEKGYSDKLLDTYDINFSFFFFNNQMSNSRHPVITTRPQARVTAQSRTEEDGKRQRCPIWNECLHQNPELDDVPAGETVISSSLSAQEQRLGKSFHIFRYTFLKSQHKEYERVRKGTQSNVNLMSKTTVKPMKTQIHFISTRMVDLVGPVLPSTQRRRGPDKGLIRPKLPRQMCMKPTRIPKGGPEKPAPVDSSMEGRSWSCQHQP